MVLTMIGYATRKSGHYDEGLAYYAKALALNPSNVNTHEYLGEAYAEKGQLDLAKAELVKVSAVCVRLRAVSGPRQRDRRQAGRGLI